MVDVTRPVYDHTDADSPLLRRGKGSWHKAESLGPDMPATRVVWIEYQPTAYCPINRKVGLPIDTAAHRH